MTLSSSIETILSGRAWNGPGLGCQVEKREKLEKSRFFEGKLKCEVVEEDNPLYCLETELGAGLISGNSSVGKAWARERIITYLLWWLDVLRPYVHLGTGLVAGSVIRWSQAGKSCKPKPSCTPRGPSVRVLQLLVVQLLENKTRSGMSHTWLGEWLLQIPLCAPFLCCWKPLSEGVHCSQSGCYNHPSPHSSSSLHYPPAPRIQHRRNQQREWVSDMQ